MSSAPNTSQADAHVISGGSRPPVVISVALRAVGKGSSDCDPQEADGEHPIPFSPFPEELPVFRPSSASRESWYDGAGVVDGRSSIRSQRSPRVNAVNIGGPTSPVGTGSGASSMKSIRSPRGGMITAGVAPDSPLATNSVTDASSGPGSPEWGQKQRAFDALATADGKSSLRSGNAGAGDKVATGKPSYKSENNPSGNDNLCHSSNRQISSPLQPTPARTDIGCLLS